jgi:hypothetical protein
MSKAIKNGGDIAAGPNHFFQPHASAWGSRRLRFLPSHVIPETETRSGLICQELDVAMCESDSSALTDRERFDKP